MIIKVFLGHKHCLLNTNKELIKVHNQDPTREAVSPHLQTWDLTLKMNHFKRKSTVFIINKKVITKLKLITKTKLTIIWQSIPMQINPKTTNHMTGNILTKRSKNHKKDQTIVQKVILVKINDKNKAKNLKNHNNRYFSKLTINIASIWKEFSTVTLITSHLSSPEIDFIFIFLFEDKIYKNKLEFFLICLFLCS